MKEFTNRKYALPLGEGRVRGSGFAHTCDPHPARKPAGFRAALSLWQRGLAFLLLLPVLCLAQAPSNAPTGNVENGKKLFTRHDCYWCHGTAGQGGSAGARIGGTALSLQ